MKKRSNVRLRENAVMDGSCLEQTQQSTSYKVSVSAERVEELKRKVKIKGEKKETLLTLRQKQEHQSDTKVFTMTMEILLEPTSNKLLVERFDTSAGNPVKEILLKLNLPDHRSILTDLKILKDGGEGAEYTWEREDQFKTKYPHLFASTSSAVGIPLVKVRWNSRQGAEYTWKRED
ncbi:hypothetical protein Tco_1273570 [Tanacetum coccineum]